MAVRDEMTPVVDRLDDRLTQADFLGTLCGFGGGQPGAGGFGG